MTLFENICDIVCKDEGVNLEDLKNNSRVSDLVYARQLIIYLSKELKVGTYESIGRVFGRDHATALYACKSIKNYYDTDKHKREKIDRYINKLKGVQEVIRMSDLVDQKITTLKLEIGELQNKILNLQLLVNNIDNFIKELKL